jgi:hypothetical protein
MLPVLIKDWELNDGVPLDELDLNPWEESLLETMIAELVCWDAEEDALLVLRLKTALASVHSRSKLSSHNITVSYLEDEDAGNVDAEELLLLELPIAAPEVSCAIEDRTIKVLPTDIDQPSEGRIVETSIGSGCKA